VRITARGFTPKPDHFAEAGTVSDAEQARKGSRRAFWGEGWIDTPVYDGAKLGAGAHVEGPALIEEPFTVIVLPPDTTADLDTTGNYVVELT
jgi:N-methylhydantoinase A/oxoprolinase/acetone carboxylase beta subunit